MATRKVTERLALIDKRGVEECLHKQGLVGDGFGRIVSLEDVVRQQSANGDAVVFEFDGLTLGDVSGDRVKGLVGGCKDGYVTGGSEGLGNVWNQG